MKKKYVFRNSCITPDNDEFLRRFTGVICANTGIIVSTSMIINAMITTLRKNIEFAKSVEEEALAYKSASISVRKILKHKE